MHSFCNVELKVSQNHENIERCTQMLLWRFNVADCGPGSSVGIATELRNGRCGIESRWGRDFPHLSIPALRPKQTPVQWVPGLSRG